MQAILFFFVILSLLTMGGKSAGHNILAVIGIAGVIVSACFMVNS